MEAFHVVATHPQLLPSLGDAISQYDVFGNFSRAITPNGVPSPHVTWVPTQQDIFDAMSDRNLDEPPKQIVPDGETARHLGAEAARASLRPALGDRVDELCDAELTESIYYTVFPNFHPWGAYNRIVYRFRPYGNDHRRSIMECMFLSPFPGDERPPAAPIHWLADDDDWTDRHRVGHARPGVQPGRVQRAAGAAGPRGDDPSRASRSPTTRRPSRGTSMRSSTSGWRVTDSVTFDATDDSVVQCPYPHYREMRDARARPRTRRSAVRSARRADLRRVTTQRRQADPPRPHHVLVEVRITGGEAVARTARSAEIGDRRRLAERADDAHRRPARPHPVPPPRLDGVHARSGSICWRLPSRPSARTSSTDSAERRASTSSGSSRCRCPCGRLR